MLFKLCLAVVTGLTVLPPRACAAENAMSRYVDVCMPKDAIFARNRKITKLMPEQWQCPRRVYVLNPNKPADLPCDNKAVLTQLVNRDVGVVSFIEGDKAIPMHTPPKILPPIHDVVTAKFNHEGTGL